MAPPSDAETSCNSGVQAETCPYLRLLHVPFLSDVPFSGPFICRVYQLLGARCTVMCGILHFCRIDSGKKCARKHKFLKFISQIYFFSGMTPLTGPSLRQVATPHALTACSTAFRPCAGASAQAVLGHKLHCVSKNVPPLTCYNLYIHRSIATIFGKNVAEKVGNENILYFPTSPN